MLEITLYDTEHCYGFEFKFEDEQDLNSFLKLNPRYELFD